MSVGCRTFAGQLNTAQSKAVTEAGARVKRKAKLPSTVELIVTASVADASINGAVFIIGCEFVSDSRGCDREPVHLISIVAALV